MKSKNAPLIRFVLILVLSALLGYVGQPFVHGNEKAIDLIINVFAILAGFLIAIMTLFSDMRFDEDANWRQLQVREQLQGQKYSKHSMLFYTYLAVLICVFVVVLLNNKPEYQDGNLIKLFEHAYLCLACISVFYSMFLPSRLIQSRKEELKKLMDKKKPQYPEH
jgi:amino acid permease